jgi:hypothetical protein
MRGGLLSGLSACALIVLTSGCALHRDKNPHNDVLVFGTQTKLGVDISAPLNSATLPAFNIGYNRAEAVWMPLRPSNGTAETALATLTVDQIASQLTMCDNRLKSVISDTKDRNLACLSQVLPSDKYVSTASGINSNKGGTTLEIDTYSVFATFGVRGSVSGSKASGGLAQVFATGIAAQRLAANPQVGAALNTDAPEAMAAEARANEAASNALRNEAISMEKIRGVWSCGDPATDNVKFKQIITNANAKVPDASWDGYIGKAATKADAIDRLKSSSLAIQNQFLLSQQVVCGGG